jgi:hypothetical protein
MGNAYALAPVESHQLGDLTHLYQDKIKEPLKYLFQVDNSDRQGDRADVYRYQMALYRGFYDEGENLKQYCEKTRTEVQYKSPWDRIQMKRSLLANYQYVALDVLTKMIPAYARYFEFSKNEFNNLTDRLTGNYCSQNLSVISIKELKKNMLLRFEGSGFDELPSFEGNPFYPKYLTKELDRRDGREREFAHAVKLFRSFCSWGNDPEQLRLMVPLVRDPVLFSFVIRHALGKSLKWNKFENTLFQSRNEGTKQVFCDGLICRKIELGKYLEKIPRSVGHQKFESDFKKLYCEDFYSATYARRPDIPQVKKVIDKITFDEEILMSLTMISLLTGIPDASVRARNIAEIASVSRSSVEDAWNRWSESEIAKTNELLFYEEGLTIEYVKVDRAFEQLDGKPLSVHFDINLGEIDRVNRQVGKLKVNFDIPISKSFLLWMQAEWVTKDPRKTKHVKRLRDRFLIEVKEHVDRAQKKFVLAPWHKGLDKLIVRKLLEQIDNFDGPVFRDKKGTYNIPVVFNYGQYALKYLNYQHLAKKNVERSMRERKVLETIKEGTAIGQAP